MPIGTIVATAAGLVTTAGALTVGGMLLAGTINLVTSFGMGAIVRRIQRRRQGEQSDVAGVFGALRGGGIVPCSFIHGRWATAGSLVYRETWGEDGKTPNAYYVTLIAISDLPVTGLAGLIVNNKPVTVDLEGTPVTQGVPVPEFTVEGKDHLWIRFHDGSQTAADSYLVAKFGAHADHPWTAAAVGTGVAYLVVTALVDNELFSGWPEFLAVVDGIRLYDPREDDTAGGEGDQRFADTATHGFSENPLVAAYNILRGISYGGQPFYGGKRIGVQSLPFDAWAAAMNECDLPVALADGGTEPQFVAGGEITVDMPPADVLDELMTAAAGRIAESGGIYRPFVGAPGAALFAFTDDDIVVTESQEFEPFFDLGESVNGIASRYISEAEGWQWKDAPQRTYPALEAEDGGIRNLASIAYGRVRSPTQVQRLDDAAVKESRRQRTHVLTLRPFFGMFEPGEVGAWTSERNGYASKLFRIERADDKDNLDYRVTLKEVDPGDYDWSSDDELPWSVGAPFAPRVPAQEIVGWAAEGILITHDNGQRKAGAHVEWAADVDDVVAVRIQIRLASDSSLILDATTDGWEDGEAVLTQSLASITAYQARGKYIAGSSRETTWSDWLPFTTPDARVSQDELDAGLDARIRVIEQQQRELLTLREDLDVVQGAIATHVTTLIEQVGRTKRSLGSRYQENKAGIETVETVTTGLDSALASLFQELFSITSAGEASVLFRMFATSVPAGALAAMAMQLRAGTDGEWAEAAMEMAAYYDAELGQTYSKIRMMADRIEFVTNGAILPAYLLAIADEPSSVPIIPGTPDTITADLSKRRLTYHTLLTSSAELQFPTGAKAGFTWDHQIEQDGTGGRSLTLSSDFIGSAPVIGTDPEDITLLVCKVIRTDPSIAMVAVHGTGNIAGGSPTDGHETWDSPGTHEWVVASHTTITFRVWGGGGPGGAAGIYSTGIGSTGGTTSIDFQGAATNVSAAGGQSGKSVRASGEPTGGAGGTASGGDTNTNGNTGTAGNESNPDSATRGKGADAPGAGGTGGAARALASEGNGRAGNEPGAGGSGAKNLYGGSYQTGGGGGSGAFVEVTLTLPAGAAIVLIVGAGGVRSSDGKHLGGNGANGRIEAEWS
jgi:hypothetical protein